MFEDRDERTEKRIRAMEEKLNKVSSSVAVLADVVKQLGEERKTLMSERETLLESSRKLLALVPKENKLHKDVFRRFIVPFMKDNAEIVKMSSDKNVSMLFDEIVDKGEVNVKEMSRKLHVHELQIEEWGRFLEKNGLAAVKSEKGRAISIGRSF
ncbi:MAG: hypothetical protein HY364_05280 [Candidatus Aenigmarchaeota archaeon]|nr:hypothetical protein [Candidatus Aenigmarchaeota archaeon]